MQASGPAPFDKEQSCHLWITAESSKLMNGDCSVFIRQSYLLAMCGFLPGEPRVLSPDLMDCWISQVSSHLQGDLLLDEV
jgi:hypothetical protein